MKMPCDSSGGRRLILLLLFAAVSAAAAHKKVPLILRSSKAARRPRRLQVKPNEDVTDQRRKRKCAKKLSEGATELGTPVKLFVAGSAFEEDILTLALDIDLGYNVTAVKFADAKNPGAEYTMDKMKQCRRADNCMWRTETDGCNARYTVRIPWKALWTNQMGGLVFRDTVQEQKAGFYYSGALVMHANVYMVVPAEKGTLKAPHHGRRDFDWSIPFLIGFPRSVDIKVATKPLRVRNAAQRIVRKFFFYKSTVVPQTGQSPAKVEVGFETWVIKPWKLSNSTGTKQSKSKATKLVDSTTSGLKLADLLLFEPEGETGANCLPNPACKKYKDSDMARYGNCKNYCRQRWILRFTAESKQRGRIQCSIDGNYRVFFDIFDFYNKDVHKPIRFNFVLKSPSLCPRVVGDIDFRRSTLQIYRDAEFRQQTPVHTTWETAYFKASLTSQQLDDARVKSVSVTKIMVQGKQITQTSRSGRTRPQRAEGVAEFTTLYDKGKCMNWGCGVQATPLKAKKANEAGFKLMLDPNYLASSALGTRSEVRCIVEVTYARKRRLAEDVTISLNAEMLPDGAAFSPADNHEFSTSIIVASSEGIHAYLPGVGSVSMGGGVLQTLLFCTVFCLMGVAACLTARLKGVKWNPLA